jgi:hypothetical protein
MSPVAAHGRRPPDDIRAPRALELVVTLSKGVNPLPPQNNRELLRSCLLACLLFFGPPGVFAQSGGLPDAQTLVAEVEANHKQLVEKLRGYTYTLKRVEQQINKEGKLTKEKIVVTQIFPAVNGELVSMPLSENGKPLSSDKLAKEKERARKALRKAKKEKPKGETDFHWISTPSFLRAVEFGTPRLEQRGGRDTIVIDFHPRPDFKPSSNRERYFSSFVGEIWVDSVDRILFRVAARLARNYKPGGLLGFLVPIEEGTTLIFEGSRLPDGVWAPSLSEFVVKVNKKRSLVNFPSRLVEERSNYRRFDPAADDPLAGLPDPSP